MELCFDGHEEVCYEGKSCPACELVEATISLNKEIENLKEEIEKLNNMEE